MTTVCIAAKKFVCVVRILVVTLLLKLVLLKSRLNRFLINIFLFPKFRHLKAKTCNKKCGDSANAARDKYLKFKTNEGTLTDLWTEEEIDELEFMAVECPIGCGYLKVAVYHHSHDSTTSIISDHLIDTCPKTLELRAKLESGIKIELM